MRITDRVKDPRVHVRRAGALVFFPGRDLEGKPSAFCLFVRWIISLRAGLGEGFNLCDVLFERGAGEVLVEPVGANGVAHGDGAGVGREGGEVLAARVPGVESRETREVQTAAREAVDVHEPADVHERDTVARRSHERTARGFEPRLGVRERGGERLVRLHDLRVRAALVPREIRPVLHLFACTLSRHRGERVRFFSPTRRPPRASIDGFHATEDAAWARCDDDCGLGRGRVRLFRAHGGTAASPVVRRRARVARERKR